MIRLTAAEINPAAATLAQAFRGDPFLGHLLPGLSSRERRANQFFRCALRYGVRFGEVYAATPGMEGVAVWMRPYEITQSWLKMVSTGASLPFTAGLGCTLRILNLEHQLSRVWKQFGDFPHWYLSLLGTAPRYQGQGHASSLVEMMLDRCDQEGVRCCVDTANEKNVVFYKRFGFSVVHQGPVPRADLNYWFMVRDADRA